MDSNTEVGLKDDSTETRRGVVLTMPKRQLLSLEEVLARLERKSIPSKVALVLEWSLAGVAVRRTGTQPVHFPGPSN